MTDDTLRVKDFMRSRGVEVKIVTFGESTRTSELAAAAIGCEVGQIGKSLVFIVDDHDRSWLLQVGGIESIPRSWLSGLGIGE